MFQYNRNLLHVEQEGLGPLPPTPGWQPGPNTVLYFPLEGNAIDQIHGVELSTRGTVQWRTSGTSILCACFDSQGFFEKTDETSYLITGSRARTVSGWIKLTSTSRTSIFSYGTALDNKTFDLYYNDGTPKFRFTQWGGGSSYGNIQPSMDTWYNIIITYDGVTVKWYINSVIDGSWKHTLDTSNEKMYLGGDISETARWGPTSGLQGCLSNIIMEDVAWAEQDVLDYYNTTCLAYGQTPVN